MLEHAFADRVHRQRKQVLFVWLDGAMSQLESWDPKPGTQFGGPFRDIQTKLPGVRISELMPNIVINIPKFVIAICEINMGYTLHARIADDKLNHY